MSSESQLDLARAVARGRRARLLNADNTAGASVRLEDAVASGQAYFVVPRPDLLVVDCDLTGDPSRSADRAAAFDLLAEAAERCGLAQVTVASGSPGHRHGYLLTGPGPSRAVIERWCRDRGLDVRDRGVRPPGSPHRDGRHVAAVISPSDPRRALAVLSGPVDTDAATRLARRLSPIELPARIRSALRNGHAAAGYDSPSHARMGLAVAIRSRGGPRRMLEELLADPSSPLGATFRARPAGWQHSELRRLWDKAGTWLHERPAERPAVREIALLRAAAAGFPWRGQAGGSDLAVLEALAAVAVRAGSLTVGAALADLGVAAGVSVDTARAAMRRLTRAGWVSLVAEATPRTARVYRLSVPDGVSVDPQAAAALGADDGAGADLGADVARWRGLGKLTMRVARAVRAGAGTDASALAERLGMSVPSVRYHLRKLSAAGLMRRAGRMWRHALSAVSITAAEDALGVAGKREAQRQVVVALRARRASVLAGYRMVWLERLSRRRGRAPADSDGLTVAC